MNDSNWKKCLLHADSRKIIKRIPDASIDFILTDPPYNLAPHSTGNIPLPGRTPMNNDLADWDKIDFVPEEWADDFIRILKPTGNLFIFTSYNQIGLWYKCLDSRFDSTNFMVWHKTNPAPKIFKAGFLNSCELIFTCWNRLHTWNFLSQVEMHNFLESPICMRPERLSSPKHPAQKPLSILRKLINIASNENDILFDPFMGVGSIGVAALELNRRFIGVEIERDYFEAAQNRIQNLMSEKNSSIEINEPQAQYSSIHSDLSSFFSTKKTTVIHLQPAHSIVNSAQLSPIIKWAGGKEKELKYILPNLPSNFHRYFEPFVGGGAVFTAISARKYYVNDLSTELVRLYQAIAEQNSQVFSYIHSIEQTWVAIKQFFDNDITLMPLYIAFRDNALPIEGLKQSIKDFCQLNKDILQLTLTSELLIAPELLLQEVQKNLIRKMSRMKILEVQRKQLPQKDLLDNIETALKSAIYMYFRALYNDKRISLKNEELATALFFFIRNYSYSGMFRYNERGAFNVPYGGIAYNRKSMQKKLNYYTSQPLKKLFQQTSIDNLDFEVFLNKYQPKSDDFIFLDPPYDSEFSTYAQNKFTHADQERLAHYLIYECQARWMMIVKNTDFIYNLYHQQGINIRTFNKEYLVSFMNRNDKKVTHLLITNY